MVAVLVNIRFDDRRVCNFTNLIDIVDACPVEKCVAAFVARFTRATTEGGIIHKSLVFGVYDLAGSSLPKLVTIVNSACFSLTRVQLC